jgi:hypothetical protein
VGSCCQTRIEEVPVVISRARDPSCLEVMAERALADYLWRWMRVVIQDYR